MVTYHTILWIDIYQMMNNPIIHIFFISSFFFFMLYFKDSFSYSNILNKPVIPPGILNMLSEMIFKLLAVTGEQTLVTILLMIT